MQQEQPHQTARPRVLGIARVSSLIYILATIIGTAFALHRVLLTDRAQQISLPVLPFWPQVPEEVDVTVGPTAEVVGGGFTHADVLVSGVGQGVKYWLAAGHLVQGLTAIIIGYAVYRLSSQLGGSKPFQPVITRAITLAAITIMIGGIASQIAFGAAGSAASQQVLRYTSWSSPGDLAPTVNGSDVQSPLGIDWALDITVEFWPIGVGIALLAVAAAFRYGEKLESANTRLKADTDGLV